MRPWTSDRACQCHCRIRPVNFAWRGRTFGHGCSDGAGSLSVQTYSVIAGFGGRPITKASLYSALERLGEGSLAPLTYLDLNEVVIRSEASKPKRKGVGPMTNRPIRFCQTGAFTVGNRLLTPGMTTTQAQEDRDNSLTSGHRACRGCGEALAARWAIDAAMRAAGGQIVVANATGCLEVFLDALSGKRVEDPLDSLGLRKYTGRSNRPCRRDEGQGKDGYSRYSARR